MAYDEFASGTLWFEQVLWGLGLRDNDDGVTIMEPCRSYLAWTKLVPEHSPNLRRFGNNSRMQRTLNLISWLILSAIKGLV